MKRANTILVPQFGVRLEVESLRSWERPDRSGELQQALQELITADSAQDVDWVVGFVSSLQVFVATHDQLGMANYFGRHFVLRGMDSLAETQALNKVLDKLSVEERERLFRERRLHKETSVLLHEWAHTLGAFHERSLERVMSPSYDESQASFSPESIRLIQVSLQHRDSADAEGRAAWARAYHEEASRTTSSEWGPQERDHALKIAEELLGGTGAPADGKVSAADARRFNEVVQHERAGRHERAAQLLAPLVTRYPRDAEVQHMACFLAHRLSPEAPETLATCQAAAALAEARPNLLLLLGHTLLNREDRAAAIAVLSRAEAGLAKEKTEADTWLYLAGLYQQADTCSGAERVAARLTTLAAAARIHADCTRLRRWVGLPAEGHGVALEKEHEYIAVAREAQRDVDARRFDQARSRAQQLEKSFPQAPGAAVATCHLHSRGTLVARVKASCTAAARAFGDAVYPQYVLGMVATSEGRLKDARTHLSRALELDESLEDAWGRLAAVQRRLGDTQGLEALNARYQAQFGRELRVASP